MSIPSLADMLKSGVHFGHQKSKRHPNMAKYVFGDRNGVSIIDLEHTAEKLEEALKVAQDLAANGKTILFVGTKRQASALVKQYAEECGMPFVTHRWLGGMLTNFQQISSATRKLTKLKKQKDAGELSKYTKKEQLEISRTIDKLQLVVGGIEDMKKLPDAVFIVDLREEKTALREANQMGIPVFAMCDSNTDPLKTQYPIPANDDATKAVDMMLSAMAGAISAGKANPVVKEEKPAKKDAKAQKKTDKKSAQ